MRAALGRWLFYAGVALALVGVLVMGGTPAAAAWADHLKAWADRCERAGRAAK